MLSTRAGCVKGHLNSNRVVVGRPEALWNKVVSGIIRCLIQPYWETCGGFFSLFHTSVLFSWSLLCQEWIDSHLWSALYGMPVLVWHFPHWVAALSKVCLRCPFAIINDEFVRELSEARRFENSWLMAFVKSLFEMYILKGCFYKRPH